MRPGKRISVTTVGALFSASILPTSCAPPGVRITGNQEDPATQSETAATTSYAGRNLIVVTYNDETNTASTLKYTSTTRKLLKGTSQMGWSYSADLGKTWTYGGKVAPPQGWAVLWGDPAITTSNAAYRYVFIANLAVPDSKMPAGGIDSSVIISGANSYIGGACIARSTDGGVHFDNYQCVSNTAKNGVTNSEKGHFYDGGSMASSRSGEIFSGFVDVTTNAIDIWRATNAGGTFAPIATPFPGLAIVTHPRLRVDLSTGILYVAAQSSNGVVFINRYQNGNWDKPVQASEAGAIYPCIPFEPNGCAPGKLSVRTGPQFSFDIGAASDEKGSDAIRFLYTRQDPQTNVFYVTGSFCPASLSPGCHPAPEWGTTPGNLSIKGDEFNPNVAAWPGFIGLDPAWKGTYLHREEPMPSKVSLSQGNLAYLPNGTRIYVPFDLVKQQSVCPDNRGYWGDYDALLFAGFKEGSTTASFFRPMSDSSLGCSARWAFTSNHLNVRGFVFE